MGMRITGSAYVYRHGLDNVLFLASRGVAGMALDGRSVRTIPGSTPGYCERGVTVLYMYTR